jgi:zinc transporter ZupT
MQVRFHAINESVFNAMGPLALAGAAPLAERFSVRPFGFACAAGALLIALIRRFTPAIYFIEDRPDVVRPM